MDERRSESGEADNPLVAFSEGRISKGEAVRALRLVDYSDLLLALGQRGLPMPSLPPEEVKAMVETFVRLLSQTESGARGND